LFYIRFEKFVPFGMMSRIITFFGKRPDKKRFWRNAMFFTFYMQYKVLIKLNLLTNQFSFYLIHKDNKDTGNNIREKFRNFFFSVILNAYHYKDLSEKFKEYIGEKDYNLNNFKITDFISLETDIPDDMYISMDGENFVSVKELNEEKMKGRYKIVSSRFVDKKDDDNKLLKTTIVSGREIPLRDFNDYSRIDFGKTLRVVISYARDDKNELERLVSHLQLLENSGKITLFYDRRMAPGKNFTLELKKRFNNADIIISLISPSWAKSSYIMKYELPIALARDGEEGFFHIPFLIKPTNYKEVVTYDKDNNKIYFKENNVLTKLAKKERAPASRYKPEEEDMYLIVAKLVGKIVSRD